MRASNILILLWSLPIAISLHVFEEFAFPGGLREWIKAYKPKRLKSNFYYFIVNAAAIVVASIIALTANGSLGFRLFLYSVALMGGNGASHIRGAIQKKQYCPGTISACVLLLPLLVVSCWYFLKAGLVGLPRAVVFVGAGAFIGFYVFSVDIRKQDRN